MNDWVDVYNRVPKLFGTLAVIMTSVIFSALFIASMWFMYALVTR